VTDVAALAGEYGCTRATGDRYAAAWVVEGFAKVGLLYEHSERNRSEIYLDVLPLFTSGRLRILDNQRLIHQFTNLERRTARSGKDSVNHPVGGQDDVANAAAGAAVLVASDARSTLIKRDDLLLHGAAAPAHAAPAAVVATLWVSPWGQCGYAIASVWELDAVPLVIMDFNRCPWSVEVLATVNARMHGISSAVTALRPGALPSILLDVPAQVVGDAAMAQEDEFGPEIEAAYRWGNRVITTNAISPRMMRDVVGLLMRGSVHVGSGHVKLGAPALARSRELPVMGVLSVKPGEAVDSDPLRVALLLAVASLDPEPVAEPLGVEVKFG
jgi:hypothetical protein